MTGVSNPSFINDSWNNEINKVLSKAKEINIASNDPRTPKLPPNGRRVSRFYKSHKLYTNTWSEFHRRYRSIKLLFYFLNGQ